MGRTIGRRLLAFVGGCFVLGAVAACGNGGTASPTASTGKSVGTAGVRLGTPSEHVAASDKLVFVPATQTLHVGDIVQWTNSGTVAHTVTFDSHPSLTDPSQLAPGETWEVKLTQAGTFSYRCTIHPGMAGTLVVK